MEQKEHNPYASFAIELTFTVKCTCGCGFELVKEIEPEEIRIGSVGIWVNEPMEIAVGIIPDGATPQFQQLFAMAMR